MNEADYLNLCAILSYSTDEQKENILDWMYRTAAQLKADRASDPELREGLSHGNWFLWLELKHKFREAMASSHPEMDDATYYKFLKAKRKHRSKLRLVCSNGEVVG